MQTHSTPTSMPSDPRATKMFLRATYVPDVMLALYRADRCSRFAQLDDIPREARESYQQIAEAAVQMVCDPELREISEYFAAHQVTVSHAVDFNALAIKQRWQVFKDAQLVVRKFFTFIRGEYPQGVDLYRRRLAADKAAVQQSVEQTQAEARRRFPVIDGGKADV